MTTRLITARYPGVCRRCGGGFEAGERITWSTDVPPAHHNCPGTKPVYAPAPIREQDLEEWQVRHLYDLPHHERQGWLDSQGFYADGPISTAGVALPGS